MTLTPSNEIENQTVWNDDSGSSGGGPSSIFVRPDWQGGPLFDPFSGYGRLTPDVAFFASETHPGYAIYAPAWGPFEKPNLTWQTGGGTSASAPLLAGIIALLNQQLLEEGKPPLGCINPLLYAMASDPEQYNELFWDITEGTSNSDSGSTLRTGKAAEFYDLATGLGSLKVDAVAEYLKAHPPGS